jgi:hypothetical protein
VEECQSLIVVGRGDRPAIINWAGGKVYITVHDEHYRRTLRQFKNLLKLAHPDMHRGTQQVAGSTITKRLVTHGVDRGLITYEQAPYTQRKKRKQGRQFRTLQRSVARWKKREARWYAQYGLTPPTWSGE